jgi:hypothetical protein
MHYHITVSNSGQKIGYGVSHGHNKTSFTNKSKLPARLCNPGDFTFMRQLSETQSAHTELTQISSGPAAYLTAIIFSNFEFLFALLLNNQCFFSH